MRLIGWEFASDQFALNPKFWECVVFWAERETYEEGLRVTSSRSKLGIRPRDFEGCVDGRERPSQFVIDYPDRETVVVV